jgi:hypothetical protein
MTLDDEDIEAIEAMVSRLLAVSPAIQPPPELVDAATLARALGVSREFVYRHQRELGARRIGTGPKAPIRFELAGALRAHGGDAEPAEAAPSTNRPIRRRADLRVPLLPVRTSALRADDA